MRFIPMTSGLVGILTRIVHWYMIYIQISDWWGVPLVFMYIQMSNWWEKGWTMVVCPFRDWLSCTGCCQYLLNMKCLIYGLLFLHVSTSWGCFFPRTFLLKPGWSSYHGPLLYHIYILNQQECFRLSNWFSLWWFGVIDEPLATLCGGPILGSYF